jgi:hypothetical protein
LSKANYDSLVNSEKYKQIINRLNPNGKKANNNFGVELTFLLGFQINNPSKLIARLKSLNINQNSTSLLTIGVGLAFRFNKIIAGYDMTPFMSGNNSTGGYIHGYLSTNVIRTNRWIFSPQLGYGAQTITVRVPTQSTSSNFNSYFTTSANQVELKHSNSLVDFAIALKFIPSNRYTYVPLVRYGYRYAINEKPWQIHNGISTDAPMDRNSNFYLQLMLGFGD